MSHITMAATTCPENGWPAVAAIFVVFGFVAFVCWLVVR